MTNYPGDSPPEGAQPDTAGTEPTQPVGYWERQAAERAQEGQQDRPDPTTPYPQGGPQSGPQSGPVFNPTTSQNPYPSTPPGPQPYAGQPAGYPPPPGQAGPQHYQPMPGGVPGQMAYGAFSPPVQDHPQSTLALILGLVGVVGAFVLCGVTLVVSPFAWVVGANAVKEIEQSQGRLGGLSNARAGMILGIIGTVLLILAILALIAIVAVIVAVEPSSTGSSV